MRCVMGRSSSPLGQCTVNRAPRARSVALGASTLPPSRSTSAARCRARARSRRSRRARLAARAGRTSRTAAAPASAGSRRRRRARRGAPRRSCRLRLHRDRRRCRSSALIALCSRLRSTVRTPSGSASTTSSAGTSASTAWPSPAGRCSSATPRAHVGEHPRSGARCACPAIASRDVSRRLVIMRSSRSRSASMRWSSSAAAFRRRVPQRNVSADSRRLASGLLSSCDTGARKFCCRRRSSASSRTARYTHRHRAEQHDQEERAFPRLAVQPMQALERHLAEHRADRPRARQSGAIATSGSSARDPSNAMPVAQRPPAPTRLRS